jgi:transketolase
MSLTQTAKPELFDCRVAFADELSALAAADERVVAVCNDSVGSSNLMAFKQHFPDRLVNVGIAEQNMIGVAAGLANGGYRPFVCAAGPFLSGRATEQIKADIAYSNVPVVLCAMSPGLAYGELGPTHHSIEDLAWMRAISNLHVIVPCDPDETRQVMRHALHSGQPTYIRVGRVQVPAIEQATLYAPGQARLLRNGSDVTLIAVGTMVSRALEAARLLEQQGVSARVLNAVSVEPIDTASILAACQETRGIVTVEEAIVRGGLGSAVAEVVVQSARPVPMRLIGLNDFAPTGSAEFLYQHLGLNAEVIVARALEVLR